MDKKQFTVNQASQNDINNLTGTGKSTEAFAELEQGVYAALETYSNVHRGSGHNSMVTTYLYEQARDIVLEYLGLDKDKYIVIFCTKRREAALIALLKPGRYQSVSSHETGLPIGVRALAVSRKALPSGIPFQTGGGTTRLVSPRWIIWASAPNKFEAGTPAIINVIAFARALQLMQHFGKDIFRDASVNVLSANEILYHDELEEYTGQELLDKLRQTCIGCDIQVPTTGGTKRFINLDNGASTPTFEPVWNAVCQSWHQPNQIREDIVHEVRSICAGMLGAPLSAFDVTFTSNTTEAINLVAESFSRESHHDIEPVVLNTLLEHTSNDLPWRMVRHVSLIRFPVDTEGFIDLNELDKFLYTYNQKGQYGNKRITLVAVSGASNVLGVYNDLENISRIVHRYGARLLVDAAQLVAHRTVEMEKWGIDYLAFSAHKVYAPFGNGALVARKGLLTFSPAEMELIQTSGEENTVGIAALGKALVLLQRIGMDLIRQEEQSLTVRTLHGLSQIAGLRIFGIKDPKSPKFARKGGVIVFSLPNIYANVIARDLAEQGGIGVRYGCHCAHLLIKHLLHVSPFLEQMQGLMLTLFSRIRLPGLTRVSLGIENNNEDVDTLIQVLGKIVRQTTKTADRYRVSRINGTASLSYKDVKQQMDDFVRAVALKVYVQL